MKNIVLNEEQRKRILAYVRPSKNSYFERQNLNLLTAVLDEETGCILTMTYYLSAMIKRTDDRSDDYTYILLTDEGDFSIWCQEIVGRYKGIRSPLPDKITDEKVEEMILYYDDNFSERRALAEKECEKIDLGSKGYTDWYLETFYDGKESELLDS